MVGFRNRVWLPEQKKRRDVLGILGFETAKTMSRLLSLYKSLSNDEIWKLKTQVIQSEGIVFLNSENRHFLLSLACAERLEDLDHAAATVSRLGLKCNDSGLNRFDLDYANLKLGITDFEKYGYGSRIVERKVHKMEKLVSATSCLHAAFEALAEMEVSERKLHQWRSKGAQLENTNLDLFNQKIDYQRKEVRHFREVSLWGKTFDKSVALMAKIVFVLYERISLVFGEKCLHSIFPLKEKMIPHSAPILVSSMDKPTLVRFFSQKAKEEEICKRKDSVAHVADPSTLGGSGLAMRYANVILMAEEYLVSTAALDHDSRDHLYQLLPENLKALVRMKLSKNMRSCEEDIHLAKGWQEALVEMMGWLAPIAQSTVTWQMERNFEKMKFNAKPTVLLMETLHFSDKEKTEAAIVEVLVGLSFIFRYENRSISQ